MGLVHQMCSSTPTGDLAEVVRIICTNLVAADARFELEVEAEPVIVPVHKAAVVALISNELVTNAIKHAFPDRAVGKIGVRLHRTTENSVALSVTDNGTPLPAYAPKSSGGIGLGLVARLAQQLAGELRVNAEIQAVQCRLPRLRGSSAPLATRGEQFPKLVSELRPAITAQCIERTRRESDMTFHDIEVATNAAEFEAGLVEHMSLLRAYALSLSGRELGEDLAQEVLAKAGVPADRSRTAAILRLGSLPFFAMNCIRVGAATGVKFLGMTCWGSDCRAPGQQQWAVELSDTAGAMSSLPELQRETLILVGVGGFSQDDAAGLSNTPVGTVKSRVGRARKALRKMLDRETSPAIKSRPANGTAMNEILAQLSHLNPIHAPCRKGGRSPG